MELKSSIKNEIEKCKTGKQVLAILKRNEIKIIRDDSEDVGCFSIWIDPLIRIYKPRRGSMKVQKWEKVTLKYSGIPTFFGSFDKYF